MGAQHRRVYKLLRGKRSRKSNPGKCNLLSIIQGSSWNDEYCPDGVTCAEGCALEGADYSGTYGISASGGSLSLSLVTGSNVGSRVYLMNEDDETYQLFKLKNREFTFDVDVSGLPCGLNGALYFVSMDADGGLSKYSTNAAGAAYG